MGWSVTRRTVVASGVLAVVVGAAFAVLLVATANLRDAAVLARHSEQVLAASNRLERLLIDIETGQRGFVITGDERFLQPWNDGRRDFAGEARVLERLAAARQEGQGKRAGQIARAGETYIEEYSVPVVERARRDPASVQTVEVTAEGKQRLDALRAQFDRFVAFERELAAARQRRSSAAARRATVAASAGIGGSVVLVALFAGYLARVVVAPVRRAAAMAGRLAGGDLAVRMPETGPGEIGALERSFNTMGRSLESSRDELRLLVEEQAALRRVATLVARAVPPTEVFAAVTAEVGRILEADSILLLRYEPDGTASALAGQGAHVAEWPLGTRLTLEGENVAAKVLRTGRAARIDTYEDAQGTIATRMQARGLRCGVGGPVLVEGRLWGVMIAGWTRPEPLLAGTEDRLAEFTELVATAVANAESRAELTASRARVVAAADDTRRRIERDLHDGIQQRLVSLALDLRAAEAMVPPEGSDAGRDDLGGRLAEVAQGLAGAVEDLQEVSRGIHPAILSRGGLEPALKTLARRCALPVQLDVGAGERLPERVEVAAYYVVSEALTNATKHAQASVVRVGVQADDGCVWVSIGDDGVGGADPGRGSGLVGLRDRIEALGGTVDIASPAGGGTSLLVKIPIDT
jgi:signal transduction histidine kinase